MLAARSVGVAHAATANVNGIFQRLQGFLVAVTRYILKDISHMTIQIRNSVKPLALLLWAAVFGVASAVGATFKSGSDESLGTFNFSGATSGASSYALGLGRGLLSDIAAGDNLSLRLFGADSSVSGVFNSRNFGPTANHPLLTVVAVPEPGTMALAGLGLALVTAWRCRRIFMSRRGRRSAITATT